jgi:hypothetical protein
MQWQQVTVQNFEDEISRVMGREVLGIASETLVLAPEPEPG